MKCSGENPGVIVIALGIDLLVIDPEYIKVSKDRKCLAEYTHEGVLQTLTFLRRYCGPPEQHRVTLPLSFLFGSRNRPTVG